MVRSRPSETIPYLLAMAVIGAIGFGTGACGDEHPTDIKPIILFDGETFDGWVMADGSPVNDRWKAVDGAIRLTNGRERAGSIRTTRMFQNFVLEFEWRVAPGGNSGVKYRVREADSKFGRNPYGCEYQLLDDARHKNGKNPLTSAGSLYGLYAPDSDLKHLRPIGEFNEGKIVLAGDHIEHWLNGQKIVEATIGSDDWEKRLRRSKVASVENFGGEEGFILLQEHLSEAWFRNLRLTPLAAADASDAVRD